ncbi:hypothetical protein GCM10011371_03040 [Novosphingobium marinum]|uniref:DUF7064 domain-containing protein n=1 Tax=Novosphingobium marinum TaxID=1514948 RepID=A0A7Z0BRN0_9SPHN|nr:hypothetical protein [Novosphingobium marinum]NYH93996.1 hypothetical protein [Novosphingobium marinum]GGC18801.1 hypothetical protein GCM10011371_03040 [Novosphingobium marinum]
MSDTDWNSNLGGGFGRHEPGDEFYHGTGPNGDTLTETWFWNFHVPEAGINCFAYCWVHPNLDVVSGGAMIYKGIKPGHLACEVFDYRDYMGMDVVGDGSRIAYPNGFSVTVEEPLQKLRMQFDDPSRDSSFDLVCDAVDVPIMRANNRHFEQLMHVTGSLRLRGEEHRVDCFAVRDRSWGELRPETNAPVPPYTWVTGAFGADFAFNVGSHDDPSRDPEWMGVMDVPQRIFNDGWVLVGKDQRRIAKSSKLTRRTGDRNAPVSHHYSFEDDKGDTYDIEGKLIAQMEWGGWSNATCHLGLVEWSWNGKTGYGESQEVSWNEYSYRMHQDRLRG